MTGQSYTRGMSVEPNPKAICPACSMPILARTAAKHDGLCIPCHEFKGLPAAPEVGQYFPDLLDLDSRVRLRELSVKGFWDRHVEIAVVSANVDTVLADAKKWFKNRCDVQTIPFLPPMAPPSDSITCIYMWPYGKGSSTAFVTQTYLANMLGTRFGRRVVAIRVSPPDAEWPICELMLYENGSLRRMIRAFRDDTRWDFYQEGEPLPFEDLGAYRRRRIRDRFTREMLMAYCGQMGFSLENDLLFPDVDEAVLLSGRADWTNERYHPGKLEGRHDNGPKANGGISQ